MWGGRGAIGSVIGTFLLGAHIPTLKTQCRKNIGTETESEAQVENQVQADFQSIMIAPLDYQLFPSFCHATSPTLLLASSSNSTTQPARLRFDREGQAASPAGYLGFAGLAELYNSENRQMRWAMAGGR